MLGTGVCVLCDMSMDSRSLVLIMAIMGLLTCFRDCLPSVSWISAQLSVRTPGHSESSPHTHTHCHLKSEENVFAYEIHLLLSY